MNRYTDISVALDFADKYHASNVTIETDDGHYTDTPARITEIFEDLDPGESFAIVSINFDN